MKPHLYLKGKQSEHRDGCALNNWLEESFIHSETMFFENLLRKEFVTVIDILSTGVVPIGDLTDICRTVYPKNYHVVKYIQKNENT